MHVRFAVARRHGFDEDSAEQVDDDYETSALAERVKDALRVADHFAGTRRPADAPAPGSTLSDEEVATLLLALVQVRAGSRMLLALGIEDEPDVMTVREVAGRGLDTGR